MTLLSEAQYGWADLGPAAVVDSYGPVAGGASTLSKYAALFPEYAPRHLIRAVGSQVWADDGCQGTDWISGLLSVILGHAHPEVDTAVVEHLASGGPSWSLPHPLEDEVADTLRRLCGYPDGQARFFKTGSEACAAAIRIARAVTGRRIVLSAGYHGWSDVLLGTPPAWGAPGFPVGRKTVPGRPAWAGYPLRTCRPHDLAAVERACFGLDPGEEYLNGEDVTIHGDFLAALIVEVVTTETPPADYLPALRQLATRFGFLLIFDECITAGRYPEFTAGQHYGVVPDLTVVSKGIANGWPLAAVLGRREVMRCFDVDWRPAWADGAAAGPVYCSGTFAGETASLAAARATLRLWQREDVAARITAVGEVLQQGLVQVVQAASLSERVRIGGQPYRLTLEASLEDRTRLLTRLLERGQLNGAGWNLTAAHTLADVQSAVDAFAASSTRLDEPAGRCIVAPYRQG